MSSSDIFQQVRAAVDIVDLIGESVALKRAGKEFKGLCPFHDDRNPSLFVVPNKQIYHCFVCGASGDVFKFVREYHKMSNGEALRMLAQRAGIKLPELPRTGRGGHGGGGSGGGEGPSIREQIATTNEWACTFFQQHLKSPTGKAGLDYLHARGLSDDTISKFRLGFAPDSWTALTTAALKSTQSSSLSPQHLSDAGLIKKRQDGSPYDVFRNRVIFPIIDATGGGGGAAGNGRVIAFGGRILQEKRDENGQIVEAKYLNSPETHLFNKSQSIYGLNLARQHIIRTRTAVIVEGYMDVIACHQAGITNVVATLGTALTPEHARALKNYAQTIVLIFDSDDAGFRAADRAMEIFVHTSLDIKIASVPDGKDPCDFCIKNGGEPFQQLIDNATDAMTYQWNRLARNFHATQSLSARQEAITQFMRFVASALESGGGAQNIDPIRRGLLLSKLANLVGMSIDDVAATLKKLAHQHPSPPRTPQPSPPQSSSLSPQPSPNNWPPIPQDSSLKTQASPRPSIPHLKGLDAAEGWLLGALLVQPTLYANLRDELSLTLFVTFRPLAGKLLEYFENHPDLASCSFADLIADLEDPASPALTREAIQIEKKTADWLDPSSSLSPGQVKLLQQSREDRGLTLASVALDSLRELQSARSAEDPTLLHDLGESPPEPATPATKESSDLQDLQQLIQRKSQSPKLNNTHFPT